MGRPIHWRDFGQLRWPTIPWLLDYCMLHLHRLLLVQPNVDFWFTEGAIKLRPSDLIYAINGWELHTFFYGDMVDWDPQDQRALIGANRSNAHCSTTCLAQTQREASPTLRKILESRGYKRGELLKLLRHPLGLVRPPPILPGPTNPWAHQVPAQSLLVPRRHPRVFASARVALPRVRVAARLLRGLTCGLMRSLKTHKRRSNKIYNCKLTIKKWNQE